MDDERVFLSVEHAINMLPEGKEIHTFRQTGMTIIGCGVDRKSIIDKFAEYKPELSGDKAASMGHGIVLNDEDGLLFIATK